jgi:hypothetical protein
MLRLAIACGVLTSSLAVARRPPDMPVSADERRQIVEAAADAFATHHFDAARGTAVASALRDRLREGAFRETSMALAFTTAVQDVLDVFEDPHLNFGYSAEQSPLGFEAAPTPDSIEEEQKALRRRGYNIRTVQRLEGNVGLLRIDGFPHPEAAGEALAAAMRLLDGTDALILDLRENRGGDGDTVTLLASWFFGPDPVHLMDAVHRDQVRQAWTAAWMPVRRYTAPVYVLTSKRTYSGGEGLAYALQAQRRAQVIGEATRGGAHGTRWLTIHPHFAVQIPWVRNVSPATGANWEGTGVRPDVEVGAGDALTVARRQALTRLLEKAAEDDRPLLREALEALDGQTPPE